MKPVAGKTAPGGRSVAIGRSFPARTRSAAIDKVMPSSSPSRGKSGGNGSAGGVPKRSAKYEHNRRKGL